MKKIKKFTLAVLGIVILFLLINSCSNDEGTVKNSTTESDTVLAKSALLKYGKELTHVLKSGQKIRTVIESSIPLELNMSESFLEDEISSNKADIIIEYFIDDKFMLDIHINDGMIAYGGPSYPNNGICSTCDRDKDGNISDSTDCSTKGIQQCAYSVYQQWSTAKIVFMSLTGGSQAVFGECSARNCIGW